MFCATVSVVLILGLTLVALSIVIVSSFGGSSELPADCAVVFGAAVYDDRPSPAILRRVSTAVDLYHRRMVKTLFLTGGKGSRDRTTEARVMRRIAVRDGVDPRDIILEERARSTWENLLLTRPLTASCGSVVAISDEFHLARISLLAARQGWGMLQTVPAGIPGSARAEARSVLREAAGYLYYALRLDRVWNIAPTATLEDAGVL